MTNFYVKNIRLDFSLLIIDTITRWSINFRYFLEPLPVSFAEPQVPIISVVDQQIMTQQVTEPVQPFSQLVPVTTQPAVPVVAQPQNVIAPLTSQTSPTIVTQQPIVTQETRVFDNSNTIRSQPSNVVVEIPHPWEEKSR